MKFHPIFSIFFSLAVLFFPLKTWSAGKAIQFSVTLPTQMSYKTKLLPADRYLVSVEDKVGQCRLDFLPVQSSKKTDQVYVYGICDIDSGRQLVKPIIILQELEEAKSTLIYFETPYEKAGRTFYAVVRLTSN
jgi:hypothetical protein